MKILKALRNKQTITMLTGGLVVLTLAGGGVYLAQKKSDQMNANNQKEQNSTSSNSDEKNNSGDNEIIDETNNYKETNQNNNSNTNNSTTATTPNLNDVAMQGTLDSDNNILPSVYGAAGVYTVEKQTGSSWSAVTVDTNYDGRGGLSLDDPIPVSELSRTYRVYKTIDGQKVGPKTITIDRNLVRTNGGSASFTGSKEVAH